MNAVRYAGECLVLIAAVLTWSGGTVSYGQEADTSKSIVLEVRIGDEVTRFDPIEVTEPITVETLMKRLAERDEKFRFEARGSGETCFVTEILGHRNEGRTGRNWFLMVDEKLADRGAGSFEVGPGKKVVWQYRGGGLDR